MIPKWKHYDLGVMVDSSGFHLTIMTIFDRDPKAKNLPVMMAGGLKLELDFNPVFPPKVPKKAKKKALKASKRSASKRKWKGNQHGYM